MSHLGRRAFAFTGTCCLRIDYPYIIVQQKQFVNRFLKTFSLFYHHSPFSRKNLLTTEGFCAKITFAFDNYALCILHSALLYSQAWRNWQTRWFQVPVKQFMWVQVPSPAPNKECRALVVLRFCFVRVMRTQNPLTSLRVTVADVCVSKLWVKPSGFIVQMTVACTKQKTTRVRLGLSFVLTSFFTLNFVII